mmetsp:Transcript_27265/g.87656  ORF Transcript_27265/g.87656 Transcript_27265/m.87656 type:complete len:222 (-) Transcript_27265:323-988(-)
MNASLTLGTSPSARRRRSRRRRLQRVGTGAGRRSCGAGSSTLARRSAAWAPSSARASRSRRCAQPTTPSSSRTAPRPLAPLESPVRSCAGCTPRVSLWPGTTATRSGRGRASICPESRRSSSSATGTSPSIARACSPRTSTSSRRQTSASGRWRRCARPRCGRLRSSAGGACCRRLSRSRSCVSSQSSPVSRRRSRRRPTPSPPPCSPPLQRTGRASGWLS